MQALQNPADLSLRQVFRQARLLARTTSRASNPDWYRTSLEMERQWHILIDGQGSPQSFLYDQKREIWVEGPAIDADVLRQDERSDDGEDGIVEGILEGILKDRNLGGRPRSLGVIVHVADELAIADLATEYSIEEDFDLVRAMLEEAPEEVIADSSLDLESHSWRILPQWGQRDGERRSVAVMLSRRLDGFLRRVERYGEEQDLPVLPRLLSSPLSALMVLPLLVERSSEAGDIVLLHYPKLTALIVLDPSGDLLQLRSLPHRNGTGFPRGIGELLSNAAASMNLDTPALHVISMGAPQSGELLEELRMHEGPDSEREIRLLDPSERHPQVVPGGRLELMLSCLSIQSDQLEDAPLSQSHSFEELGRGWSIQNFDRQPDWRKGLFPTRRELVMLKLIDKAKVTFAVLALSVGVLAMYEGARISWKGASKLNRAELSAKQMGLETLISEDRRITYWESMMKPRSQGWPALELILRMIPADGSILLTSCDYSVSGEPPRNKSKKTIAFQKEWILKGYCRSTGKTALTQLSSNRYIEGIFEDIAREHSLEVFRPHEKNRSLSVTMQQHKGEYPANGLLKPNIARLYNTRFDIRITQSFGEKDELAIVISPPRIASGGAKL